MEIVRASKEKKAPFIIRLKIDYGRLLRKLQTRFLHLRLYSLQAIVNKRVTQAGH